PGGRRERGQVPRLERRAGAGSAEGEEERDEPPTDEPGAERAEREPEGEDEPASRPERRGREEERGGAPMPRDQRASPGWRPPTRSVT
ncbi:MAG TPA: hypothetical protein VNK43_02910, partial [Gemmatimonadales bacterium]|nr:hypothetical protein [Gemmatimonadales bacterium]